MLAAARIVEVVAGKGRAPVVEHAHQTAVGEVGCDLVLGDVGEAEAGQRGARAHGKRVENELAVDAHFQLAPVLSNSQA